MNKLGLLISIKHNYAWQYSIYFRGVNKFLGPERGLTGEGEFNSGEGLKDNLR